MIDNIDLLKDLTKHHDFAEQNEHIKNRITKLSTIYHEKYNTGSVFKKSLEHDTEQFIEMNEIKDIYQIPLNEELIESEPSLAENLSVEMLDLLEKDMITIGYLYRLTFNIEPPQIYSKLFSSPANMLETLIENMSNSSRPELVASRWGDQGFSIDYSMPDFDIIQSTILKNLSKTYKPAKLFTDTLPMMLLTVGYCLARYDLVRK